jgi:hypothetical protein
MSSKGIPVISITSLDFDNIARMSDKEAYEHLAVVCRLSRKRIVPAKVRHDAFRVSRTQNSVYIHFLLGERETCIVGFVPAPPFNIG